MREGTFLAGGVLDPLEDFLLSHGICGLAHDPLTNPSSESSSHVFRFLGPVTNTLLVMSISKVLTAGSLTYLATSFGAVQLLLPGFDEHAGLPERIAAEATFLAGLICSGGSGWHLAIRQILIFIEENLIWLRNQFGRQILLYTTQIFLNCNPWNLGHKKVARSNTRVVLTKKSARKWKLP